MPTQGTPPTARASALIGLSELDNNTFVIIGGNHAQIPANTSFSYNTFQYSWTNLSYVIDRQGYPCSAQFPSWPSPFYIYGGTLNNAPYHSFGRYQWNNTFTQMTPAPATAPTNNAVCSVSEDGTFFVFGGDVNGTVCGSSTLYVYEPGKNNWTLYNSSNVAGGLVPPIRIGASVVYFAGKLYVYGGWCEVVLGDLWEFTPNPAVWRNITTVGSPSLYYSSAVVSSNGTMYVFGGAYGPNSRLLSNNLYAYDIAAKNWSQIAYGARGQVPSPRGQASITVRGNRFFSLRGTRREYIF